MIEFLKKNGSWLSILGMALISVYCLIFLIWFMVVIEFEVELIQISILAFIVWVCVLADIAWLGVIGIITGKRLMKNEKWRPTGISIIIVSVFVFIGLGIYFILLD